MGAPAPFGALGLKRFGRLGLKRQAAGGVAPGPVTDSTITAIDALGWQVTSSSPASSVGKNVVIQPPGFDGSGNAITLPAVSIQVSARLRQPVPNDALFTTSTCRLYDKVCAADTIVGLAANNSIEVVPVCIANWVSGERLVVGNSVTVYVTAFHYFGIAAVIGTADDGSGHTVNAITQTQIVVPGGDPVKVIGYALTFDVTTLNDKQAFTINARVYPRRGVSASVLDSSAATTITGSTTTRNFGPRTFRKDVTLAASPIYGYVSPTTGNDGTGVVSTTAATALASPFATIDAARVALKNSTLSGKAANSDDGCVTRLMAGSHALNNMSLFTNGSVTALIIEAAPGEGPSTVTLTSNATSPVMRTQWLRVRNVRWARTTGSLVSMTGGAAAKVFTEGVTFDNAAQTSNLFGTHMVSIIGGTMTGQSATSSNGVAANSNTKHELIRGVTFNAPTGTSLVGIDHYCVVGCVFAGVIITNSTNSADNTIVAFNKVMKQTGTAILFLTPSGGVNIVGVAHVQNLFEWISAVSNPVLRISGDGESTCLKHYVYMNNTLAGMDTHGRENILYDEATGTTRRTHTWILDLNNGRPSTNTKIDRFAQSQGIADAPNRIGAWEHAMGVGVRNNHHRYRNASNGDIGFGPEDFGLNTTVPTTNTPPGDDPKFLNYQGVTGTTASPVAGAGGGDYHVQAGSPYIGKVPANDQFLDFDLDGVARKKDGTGALGAYEYAA